MSQFSENLKHERERMDWSQNKLGKKLEVSQKVISSWETAKSEPDFATLMKIADIFYMTIDELLGYDPY